MKEVILTMPIIVMDEFDEMDLNDACIEQLEDGWRFDKAQCVVLDRPDLAPNNSVVGFTPHRIVVHPAAKIEYEYCNDL